jgi:hypothetical protein
MFVFISCFSVFNRLQNILRAIGHVIRDRYEMRARESSKEPFLFNIMKDPRYSISLF